MTRNFGLVGVAPSADIYPVKVLDDFGQGVVSDVEKGIEWCIKNNIDVINMSFAVPEDDPLLKNSINNALDHGIIIIASASNSSDENVGYPASYPGVISVSSVDIKYSKYIKSSNGKIDFSAPGVHIVTTSKDNGYEIVDGNSIAAPHITGLVALLLEYDRELSLSDIYSMLKSMSVELGIPGKDKVFGEGFVRLTHK
ncbi:S8 family serine peptidase [Bacillus sp. SM2101]|uniref:S8 family serine peptidase n=1 Tax=Bacillus sp. SM2101 TaxID=2805366 RepID=UPI001BDF5ACC|nr:S8 family serine peptidase [Bacillus sp. SM2101]